MEASLKYGTIVNNNLTAYSHCWNNTAKAMCPFLVPFREFVSAPKWLTPLLSLFRQVSPLALFLKGPHEDHIIFPQKIHCSVPQEQLCHIQTFWLFLFFYVFLSLFFPTKILQSTLSQELNINCCKLCSKNICRLHVMKRINNVQALPTIPAFCIRWSNSRKKTW